MLILTRRIGETVMIGDDVTVTVLGVKGAQVRVGVNAPKSVAVHREEIFKRIQTEREAAQTSGKRPPAGDVPPAGVPPAGVPPARGVPPAGGVPPARVP